MKTLLISALLGAALSLAHAADSVKPLKVFILVGQSNMEGHAKVETFDYIGDDPATAPLLKQMRKADGTPYVCQRVWISYLTGSGDNNGEGFGKLTAGYGSRRNPAEDGGKIGPELTFGITREQVLDEPVLIIKTAWGGKSLYYDYRPPSAGPYPRTEQDIAQDRNPESGSGHYYRLMIGHVHQVLGDIQRACPDYDPKQGFEIAGFVWFQGFNDMVNRDVYPLVPKDSKENRFANYSLWMADFIRDVRKDLNAPQLPFVIGVMGVDGYKAKEDNLKFREAMAAPAALPEFRGNVAAVPTAPFWDEPLAAIQEKYEQVRQMAYLLKTKNQNHANKDGAMTEADQKAYLKKFEADLITPAEVALYQRGASNAGYHYLGCAKTFAMMGKAYAEAILTIQAADAPKPASKPNIVIILADDMGYGDPGCYNPKSKIPTPNIDRLAREGMRFSDAHAPGPLCHPSRYGLMTGQYPFRTDISLWPKQPLIEKGQMTIASLLRDQGYHTAMVGKWHLGFRENGYDQPLPGGPMDCGFDSFYGLRASTDIPPYFYIRGNRAVTPPTGHVAGNRSEGWSPIQGAFWREGGIAPDLSLADVLPKFTDEACAVVEAQAGRKRKPLLLYLAFPAPHTPWLPSVEFAGRSGAGMYGDFVMMVDAQIGRVLAALEQAGMTQDTLLIFASDNGPVWYPADVARLGHDAVGGLRGMKADAWEGGHRMPFIVRWPGRVKAGTVSDQTICFTDLLATFAEICGVKLPEGAGPDSFSMLPVLEARQPKGKPIRGPVVMQAGSSSAMMIRSGDWKLINQPGSGGFSRPTTVAPGPGDPEGQLYNLRRDPAETHNLYREQPDIVARLKAEMAEIIQASHSRTLNFADTTALKKMKVPSRRTTAASGK